MAPKKRNDTQQPEWAPEWYRDAIIYQLPLKSFSDGDGDGVGDFQGLISRLDHLVRLGVDVVWLLPFYPSPMRDDGYDIADFTAVHPDYGTMADFKRFMKEAHTRDLKVITEIVFNHTSDQHPWFQKSRRAKPGSAWRDYYVWSDTPEKYEDARIIFPDFERSNWAWDPTAGAYYWHRFYSHQPDLNFENPRVHKAMLDVLDFWFGLGVDGVRLDALPYLYEQDGTSCENLPQVFEFLKKVRAHVDKKFPGRVLLTAANQWPEDAAAYFGNGDACHMAFHFPLMPRMFMALEMENRYPIVDILEQTPAIPDGCQWAIFLRNHDELTLEMVTDEERDYMYRIFVEDPRARVNLGIRRRLAPLLDNDRRKIEVMNVILMTMPGSPVLYYGDEIGMGDNYYLGDRDGVRTPMQWSADQNAGFSRANPQRLCLPLIIDPEYHYNSLNVATQENRRSSLLWWMRRLIAMRREHCCFGRGDIEFLSPDNPKILAYVRTLPSENGESDGGHDRILTVVNLSRHAQTAALDLSAFAGSEVLDLFSRNPFPAVGEEPYVLTFGPYTYYVFHLEEEAGRTEIASGALPQISGRSWPAVLADPGVVRALEKRILPAYMKRQRWYGGKARIDRAFTVIDRIQIKKNGQSPTILLVQVEYQEGDPEIYLLPLAFAQRSVDEADYEMPRGSVAWLTLNEGSEGALYEAVFSRRFCRALLEVIAGRKRIATKLGKLHPASTKPLKALWQTEAAELKPRLLGAEQSNTSILYGDELILKLYRRTEKGQHPDLEIARHLTEVAGFEHTPAYAGALELRPNAGGTIVLGLMQRFVPNQGDAWELSQDLVSRYFDQVLTLPEDTRPPKVETRLMALAEDPQLPPPLDEMLSGQTLETVRLLGQRTAELHIALAGSDDPGFAPEKFTRLYQRSLLQSIQNKARQELRFMKKALTNLPENLAEEASAILSLEPAIMARLDGIMDTTLDAWKIRTHGDYHLGQVLFTGKDFMILDFEGEPSKPLSERRLKRSPVRDVAGMVRSYHYAAYNGLLAGGLGPAEQSRLEPWADLWYRFAAAFFLHGYRNAIAGRSLVPASAVQFENLLVPYLLEKALYEMGYELNNRPDWVIIPLRGIKHLAGV
ncbi:maltose alpha-D-glucosyltransferase [Oceanidesulfovibrio marinus]|uniref:Maltokinase n=1 Tax=Oceanidesulfovibrio marinus TaxID=370038 RepID=A0ABX6NFE5_9BACT|nr:maltose alpha-D-glucosyltransferase [Oceanidesulfovibrio marinus]QJT09346.1 maltose alpha-D-glucosyltransferase [Oceanidesulfovibrio marinus]